MIQEPFIIIVIGSSLAAVASGIRKRRAAGAQSRVPKLKRRRHRILQGTKVVKLLLSQARVSSINRLRTSSLSDKV